MIYALGYSLEIVRTVLENAVNDIYVYREKSGQGGLFYTCISIKEDKMQKQVLSLLTKQEEIVHNADYIGSFVLEEKLNLLFLYHHEKGLDTYLKLYADSFEKQCTLCKNLVGECQAVGFPNEWLYMLLDTDNINVNADGSIYFNYFIDFSNLYKLKEIRSASFNKLADTLFAILAKGYEHVYHVPKYPKDLRLFHKKMVTEGFGSFSEFYKYLNMMPKVLENEQSIVYQLKHIYFDLKKLAAAYSSIAITVILIIVTSIFCINEIINRNRKIEVFNEIQISNTEQYKGLYDIGTVKVHETNDGGE